MEIDNIFEKMNFESRIELEEMPELDLYMDQVIQLFESKLSLLKRTEDEKILTKTMINNYAKGKLLIPIKNKKYSKDHLIIMALIYNLKGALSINDIKSSLDNIIENYNDGEYPIRELYQCYLKESDEDIKELKENLELKMKKIEDRVSQSENINGEFEKNFLLLCSLVNMSNMYRRLSEKLIDDFFTKNNE